jgi:tungstate transport system ATP-binding protein
VIRTVTACGIKVVTSTHDLGQAKRLAGDVVLLDRGRIIERGGPEFFSAPNTPQARRFLAGELLV